MSNDKENWTPIRIEAPLPLDLAGALMQLIGTAWPEAVVTESSGYRKFGLEMLVPPRQKHKVTKREADAIRDETAPTDADATAEFLGFRWDDEGHAWLSMAPPEDLCLYLGEIGHRIIEAYADAVNYLEWEIRTKDGDNRYVLSVARSKGQTPGALRKKAEAVVERLRALLEANNIDPGGTP